MKKKKKINERVQRVLRALNELGGCGTLEQIYGLTDTSDWGTKTPEATIRQKLQLERGKFFVQLKKGLWCTIPFYEHNKELHNLSDRIAAMESKPRVVQIVTDTIHVSTPNPPHVADDSKPQVEQKVEEQPLKQQKEEEEKEEKTEEIDYTTHAFARFVTNPDKIQAVMKMLHKKMVKGGTLKEWMKPYRAAIEAGAIGRSIPRKSFIDEFGEVSSSSYSNYANTEDSYAPKDLDDLVELFMRVGGMSN